VGVGTVSKRMVDALILTGLGVATVGVGLVFIPAALVVAGLGLAAYALVAVEVKS
jgi:hypothetical protein